VINRMVDGMRPARGEAWETRERRGADALVDLVRNYADVDAVSGPAPHLIVEVPIEGPATLAGIPLPDAMVERLRAGARVEPVLVDRDGDQVAVGRVESTLSEKTKRVVKQRDGKCRWPGCDRRIGLEVHHCWPRSWGGSDERWNLASVCTTHHARLAPQGQLLLLGNPNNPNGLSLLPTADLPALAQLAEERARAGPHAA
jgi:ABC-type cobalamin transport system ATPase subunit